MENVTWPTMKNGSYSQEDLTNEGINQKLRKLKRERQLLKEAQLKLEAGGDLSSSTKALVHKWMTRDPSKFLSFPSSPPRKPSTTPFHKQGKEKLLNDFEESYRQAQNEEKMLKLELKGLEKEPKKISETKPRQKKSGIKLKRVYSSKDKPYGGNSRSDYKLLVIKRKYDDLLQYMLKIESEMNQLRKENQTLHSAMREDERTSILKDKIAELEHEIQNRMEYITGCEAKLNDLQSIQDENSKLKRLLEKSKSKSTKQSSVDYENNAEVERLEKDWVKKLTDAQTLYEKAIEGYKEQLECAHAKVSELEEKQTVLVLQFQQHEEEMKEWYDRQIEKLKEEVTEKQEHLSEAPRNDAHIEKLEKIIHEKEMEIKLLKDAPLSQFNQNGQQEKLADLFLNKLEEFINENKKEFLEGRGNSGLLESFMQMVNECLETWKEKVLTNDDFHKENGTKLMKGEIENLMEKLKVKNAEMEVIKIELEVSKKKIEDLVSKWDHLQAKIMDNSGVGESFEALKELTQLLKNTEVKLSNSQSSLQELVLENKLLMERLTSSRAELEGKKGQIISLEERIGKLTEHNKGLEQEIINLQSKVQNLQKNIHRKDEILEKNSSQLEERIRAYTSVVAQMERLKEDHGKEILSIKSEVNSKDSHCHSKILELEKFNLRLESQLNGLKTDKNQTESTLKRQIRLLEEQMDQLTLKNKTLQRQLETISTTYKSMFSSEENWVMGSIVPCAQARINFPSANKH